MKPQSAHCLLGPAGEAALTITPYARSMRCRSCGSEVQEGARFCSACGQELVQQPDERRVVTVLFADLVGFTTLSERTDPERVKALVDGCFQGLALEIEAFGGRVDKFVGDGVLALFGAPIAHEDDAERAVRAGLRMVDTVLERGIALGAPLQLRIGVNTGEVLVGALRAGGDYTAMGDVVNTAQRLQTAAQPGAVVVGPATYQSTSSVIEYESLGILQAKGREEPVPAWMALEARVPPGRRRSSARVRLIGREAELELLEKAVDAASATRRMHMLLVVGEAGVGKSRLATEVANRVGTRPTAAILEGRCVPYGEANIWWPLAEAIRGASDLTGDESLDESRKAVRRRVAELLDAGEHDPEVVRITSGLVHLLGFAQSQRDVDPVRAREEAARSFVDLLEALSLNHTVILVLSDLNWADDAVLGVIEVLAARAGRSRIVVLGTAREDLLERWRPPVGNASIQVLRLDPLDEESATALLDTLVQGEIPPDLRHELLDHAGGNPFFMEELVALVGEDVTAWRSRHLEIPDTLRGLVAMRLDHLSQAELNVVQDAAVWGRQGPVRALVQMGETVHELRDVDQLVEALAEKGLLDLEEGNWAFRSDSIRDVAYQRLTKADRARRHAGIADAVGGAAGPIEEATDQAVTFIAGHLGSAVRLEIELGTDPRAVSRVAARATAWLEEDAVRQSRALRWERAMDLYSQAEEVASAVGQDSSAYLIGVARALVELRNLDLARIRIGQIMEQAGEDVLLRSRGLLLDAELQQREGNLVGSLESLAQAVTGFEEADDQKGVADCFRSMGMAHLFSFDLERADESISHALELYEGLGDRGGEAWALQNLAWISFVAGRTEEAERRIGLSAAMFTQVGDIGGIGWALGLLAYVRFHQGRFEEAELVGSHVLDESTDRGDNWAIGMMMILLGSVRLWRGSTSEAASTAKGAVERFEVAGDALSRSQARFLLARSLVAAGYVAEGFDLLDQMAAEESARANGDAAPSGVIAGNSAKTAFVATVAHVGEPERIEDLDAMVAAIEGDPSVLGESDYQVSIALLLGQSGRAEEALPVLQRVARNRDDESMYCSSVEALVLARVGRTEEAREVARRVLDARATYLDRFTARLALVVAADTPGAARILARGLRSDADETDDPIVRAISLCVEGSVVGDEGGRLLRSQGEESLRALGLTSQGWLALAGVAGELIG